MNGHDQLSHIQHQVTRLKLLSGGLLLALAAQVVVAASAPRTNTLQAQAFELVDRSGTVRASLHTDKVDDFAVPVLRFFSDEGRPVLTLAGLGNNGLIEMLSYQEGDDARSAHSLALSTDEEIGPGMSMSWNSDEKLTIDVREGAGLVRMADQAGRMVELGSPRSQAGSGIGLFLRKDSESPAWFSLDRASTPSIHPSSR